MSTSVLTMMVKFSGEAYSEREWQSDWRVKSPVQSDQIWEWTQLLTVTHDIKARLTRALHSATLGLSPQAKSFFLVSTLFILSKHGSRICSCGSSYIFDRFYISDPCYRTTVLCVHPIMILVVLRG